MQKNYFTIKEVSAKVNLPSYTIRYWEEKFRLLKPLRLSSGHRRYTLKDIEALNKIKELVFIKGYSLNGARKILNLKGREKKEQSDLMGSNKLNANMSSVLKSITEIKDEIKKIINKVEDL